MPKFLSVDVYGFQNHPAPSIHSDACMITPKALVFAEEKQSPAFKDLKNSHFYF
jgi:hypothetical protein